MRIERLNASRLGLIADSGVGECPDLLRASISNGKRRNVTTEKDGGLQSPPKLLQLIP